MKVPLGGFVDERFLAHRLRSTSTAGIAAALLALGLFGWNFYVEDRWSWELLAVVVAFVLTKWAMLAWYRSTD